MGTTSYPLAQARLDNRPLVFIDANVPIDCDRGEHDAQRVLAIPRVRFAMTDSVYRECRTCESLPDDLLIVKSPNVPTWCLKIASRVKGSPGANDLGLLIAAARHHAAACVSRDRGLLRFDPTGLFSQSHATLRATPTALFELGPPPRISESPVPGGTEA